MTLRGSLSRGFLPDISIVIPTHNGHQLLHRCLEAVYKQDFRDFEVVVVDNGSTDGTIERLAPLFPHVYWVRLEKNEGFCRAINEGVRRSRAQWLVFLNNDTEPHPGWLSALMAAARRHPEVPIFASKMVSLRNPQLLDDVGNAYTRSGRSFKIGYAEPDHGQYDTEREVFGACFGAALVRRDVFLELGGLDERFFAYREDVDFCFRARLAGYRCIYVPTAVVGHLGGATSGGPASHHTLRLSTRNAVWVVAKNMPGPLLRRYLPRMLLDWGLYTLYMTIRGLGRPVLVGLWEGLRHWPAMRQSGRQLRENPRCALASLERVMEQSEREVRLWRRRRQQGLRSLRIRTGG